MKTVGVRALRENPGVLSESAANGELLLVTNRSTPVSLSVPFSDELIQSGIHVNLALRLFEDRLLSLVKAAKLAKMNVESFMELLSTLDISVVDHDVNDLEDELALFSGAQPEHESTQ